MGDFKAISEKEIRFNAEKSNEYLLSILNTNNFSFTPSCTDALELSALLLDIHSGDEVIAPSFTLSSTLNAFLLRGASVKFADSSERSPNISPDSVEQLITKKTKAIVVMHYAGISCDMEQFINISNTYNIPIVEDAAHCIGAYHNKKHLGTIGDFGAISFHQTKNIHCFEGGCVIFKNTQLLNQVEVLSNVGTNRNQYLRGEVEQYDWLEIGSTYRISDLSLAYLSNQLERLNQINKNRLDVYHTYFNELKEISGIELPFIPDYANHNAHIFYIKCTSEKQRNNLLYKLNNEGIESTKHYEALHLTTYGSKIYNQNYELNNAEEWSEKLLRLPINNNLSQDELNRIIDEVKKFLK